MKFREEYAFLSNFHPALVRIPGDHRSYRTVEHAYQASKTLSDLERGAFQKSHNPGEAKRMGKGISLRPNWKLIRINNMRELVYQKFQDSHNRKMLMDVTEPIVEDNNWHDSFWGNCTCGSCPPGKNVLGRILTEAQKIAFEDDGLAPMLGRKMIAGTGHRPNKLGENGYSAETRLRLDELAYAVVLRLRPRWGTSGMALGWDQSLARAYIRAGVPWTAAIPWPGQPDRWPEESQREYRRLLALATNIVDVSGGAMEHPMRYLHERNEFMVQGADIMIALYNGTAGGTESCLKYADKLRRPVWNLWPSWETWRGLAA